MTTTQDETTSFAAYEAIAATLTCYLDGARTGDGEAMRKAFADGAMVRGSYGGKPADWTIDDFCDVIDKGGPAPGLNARIVSIEHSGSAAMARIEAENWRGTRYTDFFVLTVREDSWRITSKVFFAHSRA